MSKLTCPPAGVGRLVPTQRGHYRRKTVVAQATDSPVKRGHGDTQVDSILRELKELSLDSSVVDSMDVATLLGGDAIVPAERSADAVDLRDAIQAASIDASPRFVSPLAPNRPKAAQIAAAPAPETLPFLLFLPGIEGTGITLTRQLPGLRAIFDVRSLVIPPADRTSFRELVRMTSAFIRQEVAGTDPLRPVYVMGESFGGLLALAVAMECPEIVSRVVLEGIVSTHGRPSRGPQINPATSFDRTQWGTVGPLLTALPPPLYDFLPFVLAPVLGNPLGIAATRTSLRATGLPGFGMGDAAAALQQLGELRDALVELLPSLGGLKEILKADTLAYRIGLLDQGTQFLSGRLGKVTQRTLVICGEGDALLPSAEEAKARSKVCPGLTHAMLLEAPFDLASAIVQEGFYVRRRVLSADPGPLASVSRVPEYGRAVPIDVPSPLEVEKDREANTQLIERAMSPVFLSTLEGGRKVRGLDGIPDARPMLFIGNHQAPAVDMGPLVSEVCQKRGILMRALAHPILFEGIEESNPSGDAELRALRNRYRQARELSSEESRSGGGMLGEGLFGTYGCVPVGPTNLVRLLKNGEAVLLFPGGAREALKQKGEKYKLFWPQKGEFVRAAAKFGATIVPFAAVGAEDSAEVVLDADELSRVPVLGELSQRLRENAPQARRGVSARVDPETGEAIKEDFASGLLAPRVPDRLYIAFQEPIELTPDLVRDRAKADEVYEGVKASVESGISYLLEKRESDPYRDFFKRMAYEAPRGWRQQAPSFDLE